MACRAVVLLSLSGCPPPTKCFNPTCCFLCPILLRFNCLFAHARHVFSIRKERLVTSVCRTIAAYSSAKSRTSQGFQVLTVHFSAQVVRQTFVNWPDDTHATISILPLKTNLARGGLFVGRWGKSLKRDRENLHTALLKSYDWPFFSFSFVRYLDFK